VLATYMVTYGVARFVIERMRTDSLYIGPLPAALWLSMAMVAGGGILFILNRTVFDEGATVPETV
jgi:phosphatidylglycerol---prolipoprotein diacylglyceryl transferase